MHLVVYAFENMQLGVFGMSLEGVVQQHHLPKAEPLFEQSGITSCKMDLKEVFWILALAACPCREEAGLSPSWNISYADTYVAVTLIPCWNCSLQTLHNSSVICAVVIKG